MANGGRIVGDVVLGSDVTHSQAQTRTVSYDDLPNPGGYATRRACIDRSDLAKHALRRDLVVSGNSRNGLLESAVKAFTASIKNGMADSSAGAMHKGKSRCSMEANMSLETMNTLVETSKVAHQLPTQWSRVPIRRSSSREGWSTGAVGHRGVRCLNGKTHASVQHCC